VDKLQVWIEKHAETRLDQVRKHLQRLLPGICFCMVVVLAATYISEHYGSSQILGALLLGMALNTISRYSEFSTGLDFCAKKVLRFGVALLGIRITFSQISELGAQPFILVSVVVVSTLFFSVAVAMMMKVDRVKAIISGAAVGICGVSAALAVAAVLHNDKSTEKHLLCTVVGVTGLSTICMILYPGILISLGMSSQQMGLYIGASIHDVAQVFGAGEMISAEVAQLATYTKMLRVAMLVPVIMVLAFLFRHGGSGKTQIERALPPFLIAFVVFVVLANVNIVPPKMVDIMSQLSQVCLWVSMAALGAKTNLIEMWEVGRKPFLLLLLNTLFIAGASLLLVI
jgi:uncharacterized integral membrane protein (TIGR00698 family)